ncbi:hypothetical protein Ae717Ps2_5737 [Pseudonocardia sp. Ae717_Ps2]|uniref:GmrSD restriction endonuclease domain-containing protein n=1 Tax=Pseudonocardia sp. Ae717_Ps2 TaxID=1885573 RepID=UPI00094AB303|nr:DUF262 domain-containing protein [Pseudonocardia sp. Ae717_Ps2]OLM29117.1 hypothetical protein Ae717Ps2_0009 [Pseudonocardia sp. Ae717_Ps2]OLM34841.1 hypothetical protein Ae717Ps2_5737 [Pseudonocardia sp. Ae717_Ps2]
MPGRRRKTKVEPVASEVLIESIDTKITEVRTRTLDFSFNELVDMYKDEELIIDPEFQRLFRWTTGNQSRFIESLLLELPVPPIYLIERDDRVYELIDGLQRISSYLNFRGELVVDGEKNEPLELDDCDIVPELNGYKYAALPRALEIKLKRSYIRAEILRKESDPRLRYYMFKRLNTGGEELSEQEIRNATIRLLSNDFNKFIGELSLNEDFLYCVDPVPDTARKRKYLEELILRFFAFRNNLPAFRHDVADFLTEYMEAVSDPQDSTHPFDYEGERQAFEQTFKLLRAASEVNEGSFKLFGSVVPATGVSKNQFSVYHFDALSLGLQDLLTTVDASDKPLIERISAVIATGKVDPEFLKNTGPGKNDPAPLRARVKYFKEKFEAVVS